VTGGFSKTEYWAHSVERILLPGDAE